MLKITKEVMEANLITHSSKFHADEVFATAFLCQIIDNPVVCRVNNVPNVIPDNCLVYDIGGGKFDHHMRDFDLRHNSGVKYASFGLIFKEYGINYLEKIDKKYAEMVYDMIEKDLVESIDAVDNGEFPEVNANFSYKSIDSIIGDFNSNWDEDIDNDDYFLKAVSIAQEIFLSVVKKCFSKARAKEKVEEAINESNSGIMFLKQHMPFKDFVITSNNPKAKEIYFCIAPSSRNGYNIHTIPKDKKTHVTRCDFPRNWGGLSDVELQKETGIEGAIFCHSTLFLAASTNLDDAYKMAKVAIEKGERH